MKTSLLTLAVICAAGFTQAASLNWSMFGVKAANTGDDLSKYTVMLFVTAQNKTFGDDATITTLQDVTDLADAGKYDDLLNLAAVSTSLTSAGGVSGATGYNGNKWDGSRDDPATVTTFALIVDAANQNYFTTGAATASFTSSTGSKQLAFNSQANAIYKPFGASQPDPIPEPATGALALAGMALLFRRRRA